MTCGVRCGAVAVVAAVGAAGGARSPCSGPAPAVEVAPQTPPSPDLVARGRAAVPHRLRVLPRRRRRRHRPRRRRSIDVGARQRRLLPDHRAACRRRSPDGRTSRRASSRPTPRPRSTRWSPTSPRSAPVRPSPTSTSAGADVAARRRAVPRQLRVVPPVGGHRRRAVATGSTRPPAARPPPTQVVEAMRIGPGPDAGVQRAASITDEQAPTRSPPTSSTSSDPDDRGGAAARRHRTGARGLRGAARRPGRPGRHQRVDRGDAPWPPHLTTGTAQPAAQRIAKAERLPAAIVRRRHRSPPSPSPSCTGAGGQPQARGHRCWPSSSAASAPASSLWAQALHAPRARSRSRAGPDRVRARRTSTAFVEDFEEGGEGIARRGFLATLAAGALGALGAGRALPDPLARAPPGQGPEGDAVRAGGQAPGQRAGPAGAGRPSWPSTASSPCFPEGYVGAADAPTLLIHLRPGREPARRRAGRTGPPTTSSPTRSCARTWAARSGCTRPRRGLLLCPCHQSTFDVPQPLQPDLRPGDPLAAAAADRHRRRRLRRRHRRLQRSRRPGLLGPRSADDAARSLRPRLLPRLARWVDERVGGGQGRAQGARQDLPRPLVVHARRGRALLLRHPGRSPASS